MAEETDSANEQLAQGRALHGLVLAGGRSKRMGVDKATLRYGEKTQLEVSLELLRSHCERLAVSLRSGQALPEVLAGDSSVTLVEDAFGEIGPLGGILSAMASEPESAWLVLAVDLPFLDDATVVSLIERWRRCGQAFTAYSSANDGLPEPLCAVYDVPAFERLLQLHREEGLKCPRKALILSPEYADLKPLTNKRALDNVNTQEDFEAATKLLG